MWLWVTYKKVSGSKKKKSGAAGICLTGLESYTAMLSYATPDQIAGDRLGVFSAFTAFSPVFGFLH